MTHLSLFSGIGGIDLAAHWAGFETVAFVEQNEFCQKVLAKNFPGVPIYDDVRTFDPTEFTGVDLLSGGFPCQPYSVAGKRLGELDDRAIWPSMLEVIKRSGPAWVLGENVAGFIPMGLDGCISDLEEAGYEAIPFVIPACAVNAPHRRDRVFIVAHTNRWRTHAEQERRPECKGEANARGNGTVRVMANSYDAGRGEQRLTESTTQELEAAKCRNWWTVEPAICRVANGVPRRVDRLRSLGNAVVPQQVYPILKAIANELLEVA